MVVSYMIFVTLFIREWLIMHWMSKLQGISLAAVPNM